MLSIWPVLCYNSYGPRCLTGREKRNLHRMKWGMRMKHDDMARLLDAILALKTKEELEHFFEDLCTIQEINSLVQRFDVALQLDQGLTYAQIANITHASTATISRVNRSLVYGAEGYKLAIERMRKEEKEDT